MKFRNSLLAAGIAAAIFAIPAQAQFAERTIRMSNGINQEHPVGNGVAKMNACTLEKSGGKMKIQAFWGGALGGDLQATQSLRSGTQEMVISSSSPLIGILPDLGVFDLPFLFANEKEADAILDGEYGKYISDKMLTVGLVNLAYWENGFRNLTNSKKPVAKVEDFPGLKIRVMQNNVFLDTFKTVGANPVPMAFGEVFPALETKAIDGHRHVEILRGAEVPVGDAPCLYAVHGAVLEDAVGQAFAGRAEGAFGVRDRGPRRAAQGLARAVRQVLCRAEDQGHDGQRDLPGRAEAHARRGQARV
jgi:tripartite ATP-independent transporter DctP family solute receptor